MAKYGGAQVGFVLVDGYDLLAYSTELDIENEAVLEETHTLGDSWVEQSFVGLRSFKATQNGFYDDDTNASNAALAAMDGVVRVMCVGLEGNTLGKKYLGFEGVFQANYKRTASRGSLHKASAEFMGSGSIDEGVIHTPHGSLAGASDDGTAIDNAAESLSGGVAHLHVTEYTDGGYDDLTLKIRHSTDDVTYSDKVNFAAVTGQVAERVTVAGTINRYTRSSWEWNGTGTGQSVTAFMGLKRN